MAWNVTKVEVDSNIWNILPKDKSETAKEDEDVASYIFVSIEAKNGDLFSLDGLSALGKAIDDIKLLDEVIKDVSIFNMETPLLGQSGRIVPGSIIKTKKAPVNEEERALLEERALNNPFLENFLIYNNGTLISTLFLTEQASADSNKLNSRLQEIKKELEVYYKVDLAGDLIVANRAEFFLVKDFTTLLLGALLVMLVIFFLSFRARRAIVLPVIVVLMGVVWCIGFMSLVGFKVTLVTCVVPALVLTIGNSYTIHVLNELFRNAPKGSVKNKLWISKAVSHVNKTIVMAAATTMVGFLSLLFASQDVMAEFALSVSSGVFSVAILSMFFLPSIFALLNSPSDVHMGKTTEGKLATFLGKFGKWVNRKFFILTITGFLIALSSIYIIPQLKIGSDYFDYFPKGDPVIGETLRLFNNTGGNQYINLTLHAPKDKPGYFETTEGILELSIFEDQLLKNPYVYSVDSMVSYMKKINKVRFGEYQIPERKGLISLLKRYFKGMNNSDNGVFNTMSLVDSEYNSVTFYIRVYNKIDDIMLSEKVFAKFFEPLKVTMNEYLSKDIGHKFWGVGYVSNTVSYILLGDQALTMLISFIIVFVLVSFYFKSIFYGLVSIIPLLTAVCTNYLFMVILRIPLDITTIMVSSVAIGVGIDDAIHFLIQYIDQKKLHPDDNSMVLYNTFKITGRPIVLTTVSIVVGMLVLTFANFVPIGYFGILVALALFGALIGTLFFLPAFLTLSFNFRKWFKKVRSRNN
jgi:hypothetical protein